MLWVVLTMGLLWWLQLQSNGIAPKPGQPPEPIFADLGSPFLRTPMNVTIFGYMPVMFMCLDSASPMLCRARSSFLKRSIAG